MGNQFILGEWNAICDVCGWKYKASQLRKRWDGRMVCSKDWEAQHPQDFRRVPRTEKSPPWTRPEHRQTITVSRYNPATKTSTDVQVPNVEGGNEVDTSNWISSSVGVQS